MRIHIDGHEIAEPVAHWLPPYARGESDVRLMDEALASFGVRDGDSVSDEIWEAALDKAYTPPYPNPMNPAD